MTTGFNDMQKVAIKRTYAANLLRSIEGFIGQKAAAGAIERAVGLAEDFVNEVEAEMFEREAMVKARDIYQEELDREERQARPARRKAIKRLV